jgi:hypothetical protein
VRVLIVALASGCVVASDAPVDTDAFDGSYTVDWSTDPSPVLAGEEATFTLQVRLAGRPVEDLQRNHDRMVHTLFVSADLRTFEHLHQEDVAPITAEDLRTSTFRFPLTLPTAGEHLVAFDYAHRNLWLQTTDRLQVDGAPAMEAEPDLSGGDSVVVDGTRVTLAWDTAPVVGAEARWHLELETEDGTPVTDVVPWLGADGHCAFVSADLVWVGHTHAWIDGMDTMTPSMSMPHVYDGPRVDFRDTFPVAGDYRIWVQIARAGDPEHPVTASFPVQVADAG